MKNLKQKLIKGTERITKVIGIMKTIPDDVLKMYKFAVMGLMAGVLLGLWWYLQWKPLAMALFLVLIGLLAWILFIRICFRM